MALTTEQQMLVEQRLANDKKSAAVAYLLWLFVGGLGAHRFYLGKTASAIGQIVLFVLGWLTIVIGIGMAFLIALGVWLLVDAFLIPGMIETDAKAKRTLISNEISIMSNRAISVPNT